MDTDNKEKFMKYAKEAIAEKRLKAKMNDDSIDDYNTKKTWKFRKIRGYRK